MARWEDRPTDPKRLEGDRDPLLASLASLTRDWGLTVPHWLPVDVSKLT